MLGLAIATTLCIVPVGFSVVIRSSISASGITASMAAGSMRMLLVFCGVMITVETAPELGFREFLLWLMLLYLFALASEVVLIAIRSGHFHKSRAGTEKSD